MIHQTQPEPGRKLALAFTISVHLGLIAALSVLVGLETVPQILLALSTVVVLYLYRIPRQLG